MEVFNKGDTAYLLLNYTLNGEPLVEGAYQEIELQINKQDEFRSIKKLMSNGDIYWGTDMTYIDQEGQTQTFTGYVCELSQEDTFTVSSGVSQIQLRIMLDEEVGSSTQTSLDIGKTLSNKIL